MYNPVEGNLYSSGDDIVIESSSGSLRFNAEDFKQRCEQVLKKLRLMNQGERAHLSDEEREEAILFLTHGDKFEPQTDLWVQIMQFLADVDDTIEGEDEEEIRTENVSQADYLRYTIARALFDQAWLDHEVKEGRLQPVFDDKISDFLYIPSVEVNNLDQTKNIRAGKTLGFGAIRTAFKAWKTGK